MHIVLAFIRTQFERNSSTGSKQYSASIAFTLALFSHLVNHVNIRLQAELEEGDGQVPALQTDNTGNTDKSGNPAISGNVCSTFLWS